jgi:hypothetical protein
VFFTGLSQKIESFEIQREQLKRTSPDLDQSADMSSPKPVFHPINGKRNNSSQRNHQSEVITPDHERLIHYINDAWSTVHRDYEACRQQLSGAPRVVYFNDKPNPQLQDFKAFDLESWWGQRMYRNLTQSS